MAPVQQQPYYPPPQQQYHQHGRGASFATQHSVSGSLSSPPLQPVSGYAGVPPHISGAGASGEDFSLSYFPNRDHTGTPTSHVEQPRRLQIMNHHRDSSSIAQSSPTEANFAGDRDGDDDDDDDMRSSISVRGGPISPSHDTDGKGRPLKSHGGEKVRVHSDGGRVVASLPGDASGSAPAPPAYTE